MYKAEADPYCYPGTAVLINRQGIRSQTRLDAFEAEMVMQRFKEPFPNGRLSYRHYRAMHRHLSGDVYARAGTIRTVRIFKEGSAFCYPEHIDREMNRLFAGLAENKHFRWLGPAAFANKAAHFLAELNAIHPFREGNGRTQLSFLAMLADRAGHPLVPERLDPKAILEAAIVSFEGNEKPLAILIRQLVR
jgi:cell filamentation protein